MATVVLRLAGAAIGTALGGPIGGIIGGALGAVGGNIIDQRLFGKKSRSVGPRLDELRVFSAQEGAAVPVIFGRMRISGQMIWATRLEEVVETTTQKASGKGGGAKSTSTEYKYFANFAVGLCEGEINHVNRAWADGRPLDLNRFTVRVYKGTETQAPDSLISAVQGPDNAPAYRGLAYVVFERLPLAEFGNRIPQLSFEVWRNGNDMAGKVRALTIIPGATEFGYDTNVIRRTVAAGETAAENAHLSSERSDFDVALDQAQGTCKNLEYASLVVSWFGDDLRCGSCSIRPKVDRTDKLTSPDTWVVGGLTRSNAQVVSASGGGPAFGGTPSDASVVRAIQEMKARGVKVMFYPFIMMDVPAGNALPDPYGGSVQPAYPWRGRITGSVAPGLAGTPDKTASAAPQISTFVGTAAAGHFTAAGTTVNYAGPAEWSYRRMILHYAKLCALAGGVDAFLIGSELRGLTTLRGAANSFPFVTALMQLAADVRAILPGAKISYAADWSEYFGYHPADASNDHFFHLDPLWASSNVDFIGIDNYMPLADWRDGRSHLDAANFRSNHDTAYLASNVAGGEGYDWYYASDANRAAQVRTPITDGAYNKPWVFRPKDIRNWWMNAHFNRPGGIESGASTGWVPQSKPVWFTELGCPAVDKGPNSPNLFIDAKSSENALPPFSGGQQDNLVQLRFLQASSDYWLANGAHNPISSVYGGKMVDPTRFFLWAWDARPYPAFPAFADVWADASNYWPGHWLNGRLAGADVATLLKEISARHGLADIDVSQCHGALDGFVIDRPMSGRAAMEELLALLSIDVIESNGIVSFRSRRAAPVLSIGDANCVENDDPRKPIEERQRRQETDVAQRLQVAFIDEMRDFASALTRKERFGTVSQNEETVALSGAIDLPQAQALAETKLEELWTAREDLQLALPHSLAAVEAGDVLERADGSQWLVREMTESVARRLSAVRFDFANYERSTGLAPRLSTLQTASAFGAPYAVIMDLATTRGLAASTPVGSPWVAATAQPWPGTLAVLRDQGASSFQFVRGLDARATMGATQTVLPAGLTGRIDWTRTLDVKLLNGALSSSSMIDVLNGANAAAIGDSMTGFEVIQFLTATLVSPGYYRLSGLLRGQEGSLPEMLASRAAGSDFVLLNAAVVPANADLAAAAAPQNWRVGPAIYDDAHPSYVNLSLPNSLRALRPLSPAQLRAVRTATGLRISWIRRTRVDGDSWELSDVPLGETAESYRLEILDGAVLKRTMSVSAPSYDYSDADIITDFGSLPATLTLRVAQVSAVVGAGAFKQGIFDV